MDNKQKRKADGNGGGGGKRSKAKYFNNPGKQGKQGGIPLGSRGVLVSCVTGKENVAAREAISLLTEAHEMLRPGQAAAAADPAPFGGAGSDISALLASEVADLKDASKQTFYFHTTGVASTVYVEFKDPSLPSPCALVLQACRSAQASGEAKSRFLNRLYPIQYTCFASMDKIEELAAKVVEQHFGEGVEPTQFAVQYDHRAAAQLDRMAVINLFAEKIKAPHKVNLSSPEKTILVNLLKNCCGVAVVEQYKELAKFNIHTLTSPPEEGEQGQHGASKEGVKYEEGASTGVEEAEEGAMGEQEEAEQQQQQEQEQEQHAEGSTAGDEA